MHVALALQAFRGTKEVLAMVDAMGIDAGNVAVVLTQVGNSQI